MNAKLSSDQEVLVIHLVTLLHQTQCILGHAMVLVAVPIVIELALIAVSFIFSSTLRNTIPGWRNYGIIFNFVLRTPHVYQR